MLWGLDLATRCTGVTAGAGDAAPAIGVWQFDYCGEDLGQLLADFRTELNKLDARGRPEAVIYEAPILLPSDKLLPLRKIYSMGGFLELWCRERGVRCEETSSKSIKKALTGNSFAKKDEMVAVVRRLGLPLPEGKVAEDAADSFGAWYVGLQHHARQHVTRWDQAIYSRRGYAL